MKSIIIYMTEKEKCTFLWADLAPTPGHIDGLLGFIDIAGS